MLQKLSTCLAAIALLTLVAAKSADAATVNARGSVEQVYATDLTPGAPVSLLNAGGQAIRTRSANNLGAILFRNVVPGDNYRVTSGADESDPLTVLTQAPAPPSTSVYNQTIPSDGYGYMETRDGVELSYAVHKPSDVFETLGIPVVPPGYEAGTAAAPSPTLIEYSGYATARPSGPESGISALANLMGYTVVDVSMRGTGCSGGAFDFFEPLQGLDGYDVIETVARQDWVKHGKVGMFGISYGGISQLFTAQHQPPSLAAITPLSVIDQTQTTLYPGGVLNTGFALEWAQDRVDDSQPAPGAGQPWATEQIEAEEAGGGTSACRENQDLHPEAVDLIGKIRENDKYVPEVADPLSPITFVDDINVPTLLHCQWTDEQTGGHCPTLASRLTGAPKKFVTFTNGTHVDSLAPDNLNRLYDFLQIYVAKEAPATKAAIVNGPAAPLIYEEIFGISNMTPTVDPIQAVPDYNAAKTLFEAQDPYRVLYDNGAGGSNPGEPYAGFQRSYTSFPPAGTTAKSWYMDAGGELADQPATDAAADGFTWDAEARDPLTNFTGDTGSGTGGLWTATPGYVWEQDPAGTAVAYATEPLDADTTILGQGYVEAWVRSSEPNVDLQATISEIRPDGKETFVQGGWVRTKARALDPVKSADQGNPVLSLRESDFAPMPPDQFVKVTIPLYYEGHAYRTGSRIRVKISAPNGDQPIWAFAETDPAGQAQVAIAHSPGMPSRLVLPVTADGDVSTGLPPCPGLRGEPCRDYDANFRNAAAPLTIDPGTQPTNTGTGNTNTAKTPATPPKTCSVAKVKKKAVKKAAKKKRKKPRCGKKKKKKKRR